MAVVSLPEVTVPPVVPGVGSEVVLLGTIPDNYQSVVDPLTSNPKNWNLVGYLLLTRDHPSFGKMVIGTQEMPARSRTLVRLDPVPGLSDSYDVFVQCSPWVVPQRLQLSYDDSATLSEL